MTITSRQPAATGTISTGQVLPLVKSGDVPPTVNHSHVTQVTAMDIQGGVPQMDGWDLIGKTCDAASGYRCLQQAYPTQLPTLTRLANKFTISDRTFELDAASTWGSHLEIVTANLDNFVGENARSKGLPPGAPIGNGMGCDSGKLAPWTDPSDSTIKYIPSCVPDQNGNMYDWYLSQTGPHPIADHVPTIMDLLDQHGVSWKIYAPTAASDEWRFGYGRAICPTFWDCLSTNQAKKVESPGDFIVDAQMNQLPAVSYLLPYDFNSQHNTFSLIKGENWIASVVNAVAANPDTWGSTAIFLTYDDCGCWYDHVPPPQSENPYGPLGIRVPMVIISPYAKPHFVDHNTASFASLLSYIEHNWGLPGLSTLPGGAGAREGLAYDYHDSFNYSQTALRPVRLPTHAVPSSSIRYMRLHPPVHEDDT